MIKRKIISALLAVSVGSAMLSALPANADGFSIKGESKTVEVTLSSKAFEAVDDNGNRSRSATAFTLYAGTSQPDPLSEKLTGTGCLSINL